MGIQDSILATLYTETRLKGKKILLVNYKIKELIETPLFYFYKEQKSCMVYVR